MIRNVLIGFLCVISFLIGCQLAESKFSHDNYLEEALEDVIQQESGISVDFTGRSPED